MYLGCELGWVLVCKSNGCVSLLCFLFVFLILKLSKQTHKKGLVRFFGQQCVTTCMYRHMHVVYRLALHQSSVCFCITYVNY